MSESNVRCEDCATQNCEIRGQNHPMPCSDFTEKPKQGWGPVVNAGTLSASKKWHYFKDHRSLCRRWMRFSDNDLEQGNDNSPDNCAECRRQLLKLREKEAKAK